MSLLYIIKFGIINLLTNTVQAITGFGGGVLAMPFAAFLFGVRTLIPTFLTLGLIINLYIFILSYKHVHFRKYLQMVIYMGMGIPFGIYIFANFPEEILEIIIATFITIIAIRELYNLRYKKEKKKINNKVLKFILFLGGCVQGAFGIGGPLVVVYAGQVLKDKKRFRATLALLWITLNSYLVGRGFVNNLITTEVIKLVLFTLPFLVCGALLGNKIHYKINNNIFNKGVYLILLISGILMYFN